MEFTKEEELKKDKILLFLRDYDNLDYDQYKQSIDKKDELLEYWLCESDNCAKTSIKNLRKELPKYTRLSIERYSNDSDHERFEICEVCYKPLNKYLTWYEDELDYLIEECETKEDIIEETKAFKIVGLLESTGWLCDSLNSKEAKEKLLLFIDKLINIMDCQKLNKAEADKNKCA